MVIIQLGHEYMHECQKHTFNHQRRTRVARVADEWDFGRILDL
jgi:hypothetical protein